MQHEVHAGDRALRERQIGEIPFEELDAGDVVEIAALAGDETVGDADGVPAADELFRQMGTDESGAAGDEIRSHSVEARVCRLVRVNPACDSPGVQRSSALA